MRFWLNSLLILLNFRKSFFGIFPGNHPVPIQGVCGSPAEVRPVALTYQDMGILRKNPSCAVWGNGV